MQALVSTQTHYTPGSPSGETLWNNRLFFQRLVEQVPACGLLEGIRLD